MKSFLLVAGLIGLLFFIHFVAIIFHLYWSVWWFDIVMHTFGGFIAGTIVIRYLDKDVSNLALIGGLVLFAVLTGAIWEIYESFIGTTFTKPHEYILDTVLDFLSDIAGALIAYITLDHSRHVRQS